MFTTTIAPERLAVFQPFSRLADEQRILLSHQLMMQEADANKVISTIGDNSHDEFFLLQGSVVVQGPEIDPIKVTAGDGRSRYSLLSLRPSKVTITASSPVKYFTIDTELMQSLQSENISGDFDNPELMAGSNSHPIVLEFYRALMNNRLELPSLPEVSQRISQIIIDEELDINRIAALVSLDASISARLLHLANSPIYRGRNPVTRLQDAINRLGLKTTRHLVLAFGLKQQHKTCDPWVKKQLLARWKKSVQMGALCFVLAKHCTRIPPEEALLAGLLHNVGELPLLEFASQYPELHYDNDYLEQVLLEARGQAGAMILHRWNLSVPLVTAVQHVDAWFYQSSVTGPTLADILILARLHSLSVETQSPLIPDISQIPAFQKVAPGQLSNEMTLTILDSTREQIAEVKSLFSR